MVVGVVVVLVEVVDSVVLVGVVLVVLEDSVVVGVVLVVELVGGSWQNPHSRGQLSFINSGSFSHAPSLFHA
mgnify:CR=1 FL=1